jgi:hypothetical protein
MAPIHGPSLRSRITVVSKAVFHKSPLPGNGSRNQNPAVDYFYSAAKHRSRNVRWCIFAPALISAEGAGFILKEIVLESEK